MKKIKNLIDYLHKTKKISDKEYEMFLDFIIEAFDVHLENSRLKTQLLDLRLELIKQNQKSIFSILRERYLSKKTDYVERVYDDCLYMDMEDEEDEEENC